MTYTFLSKSYQASDFKIQFHLSNRKYWNSVMDWEAFKQLDGMGLGSDAESPIKGEIHIKDIVNLPREIYEKMDRTVPGSYQYGVDGNQEYFYDIRLKSLLIIEENRLELFCDAQLFYSIPYLLNFAMKDQPRCFVHSAAFNLNGQGSLLCAFGGVGKTAILSNVHHMLGAKILGDDLNIVHASGTVTAYPRPFCIYPYHQPLFEKYFSEHQLSTVEYTLINKVIRKVKRECLKVVDRRHFEYETISPLKLIGESAIEKETIPLNHVFALKRNLLSEKIEIKPYEVEICTDFCLSILQTEWHSTYRHFLSYFALSGNSFEKFIHSMNERLMGAFAASTCHEISIPVSLDIKEIPKQVIPMLKDFH